MERRYELFAHAGARDLTRYNTIVSEREIPGETLPYIVIVIDELADLMMVAPGDVEEAICRIAQKTCLWYSFISSDAASICRCYYRFN